MLARVLAALLTVGVLTACGSSSSSSSRTPVAPSAGQLVKADVPRAAPAASAADAQALRAGGSRFAGRLLAVLAARQPTVAVSPFSVSVALSMTQVGARGDTARQMGAALNLPLPAGRVAQAYNAVLQALPSDRGPNATLDVANALFAQRGQSFRAPFLDVLARYYGAGIQALDFATNPGGAISAINQWVSDHTAQKIPRLLGPNDATPDTRLVLTNAVYLKAKWAVPFKSRDTFSAPFHAPDGTAPVPTMHETAEFTYLRAPRYQAVELPYQRRRLAFDVLLPDPGGLPALLSGVAGRGPLALLAGLAPRRVALSLPKLQLSTHAELAPAFKALGMTLAFKSGQADLSGIAAEPGQLDIQAVVHAVYMRVDEAGTEAAAATGVSAGVTAVAPQPAIDFDVNRPFVFVLRDTASGAVLFAGVVSRP